MTWPAEWCAQSAVLLAWPHAHTDWADMLDAVEPVYAELASTICRFQDVLILCIDSQHESHIRSCVGDLSHRPRQLRFYHTRYNDTWTRDYGPLSVWQGAQGHYLDFTFNGWGNKFDASLDNSINRQLQAMGVWKDHTLQTIDFVLEGGSIDGDGAGTVLTTTACLLNPNRNGNINREQVNRRLADWLGTERVLWLDSGYLAGDDTDSHIDMLARFCNEQTIAYTSCDDPDDEHYHALQRMAAEIRQFTDMHGQPYRLLPLPIPAPIYDPDGQRLPASYANFLIINDAVLMPSYGDANADRLALASLQGVFGQREVIPIDCKPLIMQHGSLHCATMQIVDFDKLTSS